MYMHTQYEYKVLQSIQQMKIGKDSLLKSQGSLIKPLIVGNIYRPPHVLSCDFKQCID